MLDSAFGRARALNRDDILKKVVRDDTTVGRNRFVIRYDPRMKSISQILRRNWQTMISDDTRMKNAFPEAY